tara:strand:- start:27236 stop:27484 length:249 start_codon:yes stop_codon:yes gene_type:complete
MPDTTPHSHHPPGASKSTPTPNAPNAALHLGAPFHSWFTSPARSHPNAAQAKELPLHLIQLILTHVRPPDDLIPPSLPHDVH